MRMRYLLAALAPILTLWVFALPAHAADPTVQLKISLWIPPAHPLVPATRAWADDIEKASGGTIKATVFPSEQLGKAFDHYNMTRDGIADIAYINPGYEPGRFPIISAGQLPFVFADAHKGTLAMDEWYRAYAAKEMKDTHFCFAFIHDPGTFHSRTKIVLPTDLKSMKIRPAQSTIGQMVTMLGGTNVQASAPESRDMLERGVADAITFPWGSIFLFGIDKVVKYHVDMPLYTTTFVYQMNQDKYDSMTPAQKKVMDDHCTTEWAERVSGPWTDFEHAGRDKMKALPGHEVYTLTPEQLAAWKDTVKPLQKTWAESVRKTGADPEKVEADLQAALKKNNAGF
jgi:TRAP-type C4-dicarboxylate transport system substrate-binding protein